MPRGHCCIDISDIIREVKKRPGIFTKTDPERYRPNYRDELWLEVATSLYTNWDKLDEYEQREKVVDLKKKWRNLRDSFLKELQYKARLKAGLERKVKRKYIYYDKLKFLQPVLEANVRSSEKTLSPNTIVTEEIDDIDDEESPEQTRPKKLPKRSKDIVENQRHKPKKKVKKRLHKKKGSIDEDKTFLLSLVPSFKTMQEEQKLIAKIEILNIIRQIKTSACDVPDSQSNSGYIAAATSAGDPIKLENVEDEEVGVEAESDDIDEEKFSADSTDSSSNSSSD